MLTQILILVIGLAFVVLGANYLVDGSSAIARKAGLSEFLIGLTIVGIGTSTPEMVVSFIGAFQHNADISVGNIVGSNIFNVLLILGITAIIRPVQMTRSSVHRDVPLNIAASFLLIVFGLKHTLFNIGSSDTLTRFDGIVFLTLFAVYMFFSFRTGKAEIDDGDNDQKKVKLSVAILMVVGGLVALVFGGRLFVNAAKSIASSAGMSDKFIAVTILAGGTSMPELVTCIVAAIKKKGQLALGNIIGSNISNILLILGGSALIFPLSLSGMSAVDLAVLVLSSLLIWTSAYTGKGHRIDRADGCAFLACEAAYLFWLLMNL